MNTGTNAGMSGTGGILGSAIEAVEAIGDPLADHVIQELAKLGPDAARELEHGILEGSRPNMVPAIRALLTDAEHCEAVDLDALSRGSDAYLAIGAIWIGLALGPGSLTHTYTSASIARVLVRTGNLTGMARRRLLETGVWNTATVLPEGLTRGHPGYVHNLQVRLLHARVRHALIKSGWDVETQGVPINQVELARTWLDFTYVPFTALGRLGIDFTEDEIRDLYVLWRRVAHLLGVDPRLYSRVFDQASGAALLAEIDGALPSVSEDSRALTAAMLDAVAILLAPQLRVSEPIAFQLASAVLRRLHGNTLADALGVRRSWTSPALPLLAFVNRVRRRRERHDPRRRAATIARTIATFSDAQAQLGGGGTTYGRTASDHSVDKLPKTIEP